MAIAQGFRAVLGFWAGSVAAALLLCALICPRALAFGGVWSSKAPAVEQSAVRVIFVDNPDSTVTAIVQIRYAGPPQKFAWLIPVPGKPVVGVSSNTLFERLDVATAPQYWVGQTVEGECRDAAGDAAVDAGVGADSGDSNYVDPATGPVAAIDQGSVGPYDYVTIAVDPTLDDAARVATEWLTKNGYELNGREGEVLGPYLSAGLNLLALKLTSDTDAGAIRPVVLTYESELPLIPIQPTAVAAHDDMPIQVWVVGPSQAVPANYESLVLDETQIDWLSGRTYLAGRLPAGGAGPFGPFIPKPDNYDAIVARAADQAGGRGFVTELAEPVSQFRDRVWSPVDAQMFATIAGGSYADGIDAVIAAGPAYGAFDGFRDAVAGASTLPDDVTLDEFVREPARYRGLAEVDTEKFLQLLEQRAIKPLVDAVALFHQGPYLTRLYSVMSPDEMTVDPSFDYDFDLAQRSNVHVAQQFIQCSAALNQVDAPWRIELRAGGVIVGNGGVVSDAGIDGGTHIDGGTRAAMPPSAARDGDCSVARVGADTGASAGRARAAWLLLAGVLIALRRRRSTWACALFLVAACSGEGGAPAQSDAGAAKAPGTLTREQLLDPETCKGCHPIHYREWSSSLHAYAAQDPVFIAMNKRGQRETNGKLGDFCIKCHAPMAVVDKRSTDELNLDQLPDRNRGVSCYFCHNVTGVEGDHNGKLRLANDTTMRGSIRDPVQPGVHRAEFSEMFEGTDRQSTAMCGGCHDVVTPGGVHLERTLQEYRDGVFSKTSGGKGTAFDSCVGCHMPSQRARAADFPGTVTRSVHLHLWPGIDVPLTDFPNRDAMRSAVEDCQLGGASVSYFKLEVTPPDIFSFEIETNAGHNQPSGAAQDRRMWLEFMAYDANGKLLEDVSSGNIADDEIEERPKDDPKHDPHLLLFRDRIYDAQGEPVHMFWEAAKSGAHPDGYESHALPPATTTYIEGKHAVLKQYRASGPNGELPARVTARLRMRPIGLDVLRDLVDSGDLDPAIAAKMPTLSFGAQIEWTPEDGLMQTVSSEPNNDCATYRCLLDPSTQGCTDPVLPAP